MVDDRYKKRILALIETYFPFAGVYLYGSRARGDHGLASDIDVAVDVGQKADERKMARIRLSIEDLNIPVSVDVVDLYALSDEFRKNIEKDKIVWKKFLQS